MSSSVTGWDRDQELKDKINKAKQQMEHLKVWSRMSFSLEELPEYVHSEISHAIDHAIEELN